MKRILPEKPSELILVALADLEKCEADDRYEINMSDWHDVDDRDDHKVCLVCLGGSVMAQTLEVPVDVEADNYGLNWEHDLDDRGVSITAKLHALDFFRVGDLEDALTYLRLPKSLALKVTKWFFPERTFCGVIVPPYDSDKDGFKSMLRKIADAFEEFGY